MNMTHKPLSHALTVLTGLIVSSGVVLTMTSGTNYLQAELTGQGSTVIDAELHSAAQTPAQLQQGGSFVPLYERAYAAEQLVLGILLIVLAFFFHGLVRARDEQPVHITVKQPKKKKQPAWYWIELKV